MNSVRRYLFLFLFSLEGRPFLKDAKVDQDTVVSINPPAASLGLGREPMLGTFFLFFPFFNFFFVFPSFRFLYLPFPFPLSFPPRPNTKLPSKSQESGLLEPHSFEPAQALSSRISLVKELAQFLYDVMNVSEGDSGTPR